MVKKTFFTLLFLSLALPFSVHSLSETDDYTRQYNELSQKITELSRASVTLSNQLKLIDTQISQTQLKIKQTTSTISILKQNISDLSVKIKDLDGSLNNLSGLYLTQIVQNYKLQKKIPFYNFITSANFNNYFENYKYLAVIQKNSQDTLINLETTRTLLDQEKQDKAEKQKELEVQEKSLAKQQSELASQKTTKNNLLKTTQKQLADAQAQLTALRNFSKGGNTCLSSSPGTGSDGWFYSQRDPRWCNQFIALSQDTIGEVGCYITAVSMIWKKYGFDMTPSAYAANANYFLGATAWMTNPAPPPGYTYQRLDGYNQSRLDAELKAGRPVIAQMYMKTVAGMHFIVIKSGSNGNYQIHDPWFGPDLNFSDHYTTSGIMSLRLITKS